MGITVGRSCSEICRLSRLKILRDCDTGRRVVRDGLASIDSALYSSSISLSAARSDERPDLVDSGALDVTLRSMAIR
jgi:hypothetical protein